MDTEFVKINRIIPCSNGLLIVSGNLRTDEAQRIIVITYKHVINGQQTIEQLTLTFDEFEELVKVVRDLNKTLDRVEEVL